MIRLATTADLEAIGELWEQLVAYHRALSVDLPRASENGAALYARRLSDRLDDTHARILVAEHQGTITGYVFGVIVDLVPEVFLEEQAGFIADIFVLPQFRKQGVGRDLVEAMLEWFGMKGITYYEWYVAAANHEARAFWEKIGGRQVMLRMRANVE